MPDIFTAKPAKPEKPKKVEKKPTPPTPPPQIGLPSRLGVFTTLSYTPENISFENLQEGEKILLFLRRDFITNAPWIAITTFSALLPLFLPMLLSLVNASLTIIPVQYLLVLTGFYYLIVLGYALTGFLGWFYNIGLVTNQRIIDVDFSNVLYKSVAATLIRDVEDVEYTQAGFLSTFFDYGDVLVQTEAQKANIEFSAIPRPAFVTDTILNLREEDPHE